VDASKVEAVNSLKSFRNSTARDIPAFHRIGDQA
jgi:hypothetical protein